MKHLEFDKREFRFSLTGDCITVFCDGKAIYHKFYESHEKAKFAFLGIVRAC